jgi:hypothetical protein
MVVTNGEAGKSSLPAMIQDARLAFHSTGTTSAARTYPK